MRLDSNILFYTIGMRDVQVLSRDPTEGRWWYAPIDQKNLADICDVIISFFKDGKVAKFASLQDEHFQEAREKSHTFINEIEDVFLPESSSFLCFPILESVLKLIALENPNPLVRLFFFNTDRQGTDDPTLAQYKAKEPYAFPRIIQEGISAIVPKSWKEKPLPHIEEVIILKDQFIDQDRVFRFMEEWINENRVRLDQADDIYLVANPGIPAIGRALTTFLGIAAPVKLKLIEKGEDRPGSVSSVPVYEQVYRDRHSILERLRFGDFAGARQIVGHSKYGRHEKLVAMLEIADEKIQGTYSKQDKARKKLVLLSGEEKLPSWTRRKPGSDPLEELLVKMVHAYFRTDHEKCAVLLISALETACKSAIQILWPGGIQRTYSGEAFDPAVVDQPGIDQIGDAGLRIRIQDAKSQHRLVPLNFFLYEELLKTSGPANAPLVEVIVRSKPLRDVRNDYIHQGKTVPPLVILNTLEKGFHQISDCPDPDTFLGSRFIQVLNAYRSIAAPPPIDYWPKMAASEIARLVMKIALKDLT